MSDPILPPELNPRGPGHSFEAAPKEPKDPGRRGWRRPLGITAAVLAVLVLLTSGVLYTRYLHYDHNLTKAAGVLQAGGTKSADGAENVLLVGSDSRSGAGDQFAQAPSGQEQVIGQRSDTVILAHLAKGHQKATLVSLPRDSWINIPAYTDAKGVAHPAHMDKLNSAFSLGGAPLLVNTVQQLTGVHIDHYVEIDFAGFQNMVNSLGGVDVCLARPAHDVNTGINLSAGNHHLDGQEALAFVRQRYGLPLGDIDRIKRQQAFLASMLRKVESAGTLANPLKLNAFIDALTKSVTVDSGLSAAGLGKLALKLKGISSGNVVLTTMPLSGFAKEAGQDVDVVDQAKSQALFQSLIDDNAGGSSQASAPAASGPTVAPSTVHVKVFNGAGIQGLAARASSDLAKLGFVIDGAPGNRGAGATTTVINYNPSQAAQARTLQAAIPGGATLQENGQLGAELELVLGSSYNSAAATGGSQSAASAPAGAVTGAGTTAAAAGCTN
ncbi:MAG TPA: LCP family protein [Acidothermaceae bacterium]|nr:LCP family protein [Acidothermaceae bacterium]